MIKHMSKRTVVNGESEMVDTPASNATIVVA